MQYSPQLHWNFLNPPNPHGMAPLHVEIPYSLGKSYLISFPYEATFGGEVVWGRFKKMLIWTSELVSSILLNFQGRKSFSPPQTKPLLAKR